MFNNSDFSVKEKIEQAPPGSIFFSDSFLELGSARAIAKTLERLTNTGKIRRIAQGIYLKPEIDPFIGPVSPAMDTIAGAIAKRDKARIVPTGAYALNRLHLSTQMPMNLIYLTDGAARKVKIGNRTITFKKATPKNVAAIGPISKLVIQALRSIGKENLTNDQRAKVIYALQHESLENLKHDLLLAPEWIRKIMRPVIHQMKKDEKSTPGMA
jgi:hypothetical protein